MRSTDASGRKLLRMTLPQSDGSMLTFDEVIYPGEPNYDSEEARDYATYFDPVFYYGEYPEWVCKTRTSYKVP